MSPPGDREEPLQARRDGALGDVQTLPTSDIEFNPNNPRETITYSKIRDLADTIETQGLLQPVLVRPVDRGYQLVHGERRLRAVRSLGRDTIPARVEPLTEEEALERAITENLQREDVSAIGEARSYQLLIDEHGLTQTEAADQLGVSQGQISNRLGLLDLPGKLQGDILHKIFSPWQAKELARVWGEYYLRDTALDFELSVREIRHMVDQLLDGDDNITLSREWSTERLANWWGEPDPETEYETETKHIDDDGELESISGDVEYLDGSGAPVEVVHVSESPAAMNWAGENIDGIDKLEHYGDVRPIRVHWTQKRLLLGYGRLRLASRYEYEGDFRVEIIFPSGMWEWALRHPRSGEEVDK